MYMCPFVYYKTCYHVLLQDQVMGFLHDVFSVDTSNYSSNSALAEDVLKHLQTRTTGILSHFDASTV